MASGKSNVEIIEIKKVVDEVFGTHLHHKQSESLGYAALALWMEPHNGNSSDKKEFHETIKRVRSFQQQLKNCPDFKWVADSALYSKEGRVRAC